MKQPTPDKIAKLPKWAQEYLSSLELQRSNAIGALENHLESTKPSHIYYEDFLFLGGSVPGPRVKRFFVMTDRITVENGGVRLEVRCQKGSLNHDAGISLQWTTPDRSIGMVAMVPKSFQSVDLVSRENMRT